MPSTELLPSYLDVTKVALAGFLARYREPTLTAYTVDLRSFIGWYRQHDLEPLRVTRGELEMYVRHLEGRGYAAATVARRLGTPPERHPLGYLPVGQVVEAADVLAAGVLELVFVVR
jgi:site-specific recombinase XerD